MFEQKDWVIACMDCKELINLQKDRCQNLIDYQGNIIQKSLESIKELHEISTHLNIHFPLVQLIKEFVEKHEGHKLQSGPDIHEEETHEFHETILKSNQFNKKGVFHCSTCNKKSTDLFFYHENPGEQKFTVKDLENFYTILELYNILGLRIQNHKFALSLEENLPFLKLHCYHELLCIRT